MTNKNFFYIENFVFLSVRQIDILKKVSKNLHISQFVRHQK